MSRESTVAHLAALALALGGCGSHHVVFDLSMSVTAPFAETCSGTNPSGDTASDAPWAVGSLVPVQLLGAGGAGPCTIGGKLPLPTCNDFSPPKNAKVTATNPSVWAIDSGPDANDVVTLRAVGPGTGGIHVTADNADAGDLVLRALTPVAARLSWAPGQPTLQDPPITVTHLVVVAGQAASVTTEIVDAASVPLCVPPGTAITGRGVTIASDAAVNEPITVGGGAPGNGGLDVPIAGGTATLPIQVIANGDVTGFDAAIAKLDASTVYLRLSATYGVDPVAGAGLLVEDLTPAVVEMMAAGTDMNVTQLRTNDGAIWFWRVGARAGGTLGMGQAQLRFSVPETTLPSKTVSFTFPSM